jgi:hypothetical protein
VFNDDAAPFQSAERFAKARIEEQRSATGLKRKLDRVALVIL